MLKKYVIAVLVLTYAMPLLGIVPEVDVFGGDLLDYLRYEVVLLIIMTVFYGGWVMPPALALQYAVEDGKARLPEPAKKPVKLILARALAYPVIIFPLMWLMGLTDFASEFFNRRSDMYRIAFTGMYAGVLYAIFFLVLFLIGLVSREDSSGGEA